MTFLLGLLVKWGVPQSMSKAVFWIIIGLLGAGALGIAYWKVTDGAYKRGEAHVQAKWDKDAHDRQEAYMALQADYRAKEQAWQAKAAVARQERTNEDARTIAGLQRTLASLRSRPERPAVSGAAAAPGDNPAAGFGTGAFLYRSDGEFLAGEAARADRIRAALIECYKVQEGP